MTLAFVLVAATLLVMRSVNHIVRIESGLAYPDTLSARLSLPPSTYPHALDVLRFYGTLHQDLSDRLGPQPIAIVDELPLTGDGGRVQIRASRSSVSHDGIARVASPKYFETIGIRMLDGRDFTARDDRGAPLRAIVSAAFARAVFGATTVVGRELLVGSSYEPAEVIGVVSEVKHRSLDEADIPTIYLSVAQRPSRSIHIVTRSSSAATQRDLVEMLRSVVASHDPLLPLYAVRSVQEVIDASPGVPLRKVVSIALMVFGLVAMVIAAVGVFGVLADDVNRRRVEFALRVALGADPRRVRRQVVTQALALLTPALASGLLLSASLSPALRPLLFQISAVDAPTLALVGVILAVVTVVAATVPATRAARTRPAILLRGG